MSHQNPHPGDIRHSQIPVGCLTPLPSGLTLIGALARRRYLITCWFDSSTEFLKFSKYI